MNTDIGQVLTVWTVRASMGCCAIAFWRFLFPGCWFSKSAAGASLSAMHPQRIRNGSGSTCGFIPAISSLTRRPVAGAVLRPIMLWPAASHTLL